MTSAVRESSFSSDGPATQPARIAIVIVGILIGQIYLYFPALFGREILLPVDLLSLPGLLFSDAPPRKFNDIIQGDQVQIYEPQRWFAAAEVRAGRWPLWSPLQYAGAPAGLPWSCFQWLYVAWPSPKVYPFIFMLLALVSGTGAYLFFHRVLEIAFWPASLASWCYPLTGFFVVWHGHGLPHAVAWLPWILYATDRAVKTPSGFGGVSLAIVTILTIGTGAIDIVAQVLLVSGCFALWRLSERILSDGLFQMSLIPGVLNPVAGWGLGFLMAAGMLLPTAEYLPTGARVRARAAGSEERPPIGVSALPLIVLPELQGSHRSGSFFLGKIIRPESAAMGYAGLIAALFLAPLAAASGKRRSEILFFSVMGFLGIAWALNAPGLVQLYRAPLLKMFSFNRFAFVTSWSILCLAAMGLDSLWREIPKMCRWYYVPIVVLIVIAWMCLQNVSSLSEPFSTQLEQMVIRAKAVRRMLNDDDVWVIKHWYVMAYRAAAVTSLASLIGWILLFSARIPSRAICLLGGGALLVELLRFAGQSVLLCDPDLYYPRIPVLEQLANAPPGRFLGVECLAPCVTIPYGLRDIRGYDAVDPAGMVDLLDLVRDQRDQSPPHARTMYFLPRLMQSPDGTVQVPGVLNMLNLRYFVYRRAQLPERMQPLFVGNGYAVWENPAVLPRAFIPRAVSNDRTGKELLTTIGQPDFNAARHSYASIATNYDDCRGQVQIVREHPQEIVLDVDMETAGLVILSDLWHIGWHAKLNGHEVPIVRANYSLRGVEVPRGHSTIVMYYKPASLIKGLQLTLAGLIITVAWGCVIAWYSRRKTCATIPTANPT